MNPPLAALVAPFSCLSGARLFDAFRTCAEIGRSNRNPAADGIDRGDTGNSVDDLGRIRNRARFRLEEHGSIVPWRDAVNFVDHDHCESVGRTGTRERKVSGAHLRNPDSRGGARNYRI